jgi:glyceraldehyde 3-phosphate dehydrogenase
MDVSIVDLTFESTKSLSKDAIHAAMKAASEGPMKGILGYTTEELVSSDYIGDARSSIFDATITQVMGDRFGKVFAWYDNEWGFSNRMIELSQLVASKL